MTTWARVAALGVGVVVGLGQLASAAGPANRLAFAVPQSLPGAAGGTEPQLAVAPDGTRFAVTGANTTANGGTVRVFRSSASGGRWAATQGQLAGVRVAGPDVAVVATPGGGLVALEEDSAALSLVVNHSEDGGRTWTASTGLPELVDQDRPWLASAPGHRVYLLFHNGFSSNATHDMFVETSTDDGASFGPPVPLALPGSDAWADLQCADSGGPSALLVNARTGRLYAVWGTRHGPLGGCGVLPPSPFTLVPEDRVWVATSATGAPGTWQAQVAVDASATHRVVSMQMSPAALDARGNLWLAWSTPPRGFPDDTGAGISVRYADPTLQRWSAPQPVVAQGQPGHVLAQLVAGAPGRLGLVYLTGVTKAGTTSWYAQASLVTGALTSHPSVSTVTLTHLPSYRGSATDLMGGGCDPSTSPLATVENNPVTCPRSADVIDIALDRSCRVVVTWPSLSPASNAVLGASTDATWVTTQTRGPSLCRPSPA